MRKEKESFFFSSSYRGDRPISPDRLWNPYIPIPTLTAPLGGWVFTHTLSSTSSFPTPLTHIKQTTYSHVDWKVGFPRSVASLSLLSPGGHSSAPQKTLPTRLKLLEQTLHLTRRPKDRVCRSQSSSYWLKVRHEILSGLQVLFCFTLCHFPGEENNIWEQNVSDVFTGAARNVGGGGTLEASAPCGFSEPCLPVQQGAGRVSGSENTRWHPCPCRHHSARWRSKYSLTPTVCILLLACYYQFDGLNYSEWLKE